ncbi:sodium/hydrogen exchanger [Hymenopellis radicata]|nr:sodium/hydrogen exchanger [Hymenopellis radicata]
MATSASPSPVAEDEEFYSSWSLFLVCMLLVLSLWTSYYLQIKRIRAVHETLVSIFAGMAVGLIVRLAPGTMIREMLTFKHTLFFNLLLPPIILNSGYELKQENFFRNFGSILTFAFLGTFISAVGVGVLVYIYSFLGLESLDITLLECLIFGSTLSATDPVTILAIFNQYKVDPKLYTVIFGESLLNDAVSIVMYETLSQFHGTDVYLSSIFHGIGIFLLSFSVSMAMGVAFGLAMHVGIVSLLFCGITLKHYAYHTMSRRTQRSSKYIFSTLAQLSENFIFIYLGMSLFTSSPTSERVTNYVKPLFITITTVAVIFTRYAAVFPLSEAINFFHKHARGQRTEELPHSYQMMLFWAGLRGAVGVALAAGFKGENREILRTTVLVVVVLTVIIFGGTTARMLEVLGIRTGVEDEAASSDEDEETTLGGRTPWLSRRASNGSGRWGRYADDEASSYLVPQNQSYAQRAAQLGSHYMPRNFNHQAQNSPLGHGVFSTSSSDSLESDAGDVLPMAPSSMQQPTHPPPPQQQQSGSVLGEDGKWFQTLDERYLLPLFSNATASRTFHARRARRGMNGSSVPAKSEDDGEGSGQEVELGSHGHGPVVGGAGVDSRVERGLASPMLRPSSSERAQ